MLQVNYAGTGTVSATLASAYQALVELGNTFANSSAAVQGGDDFVDLTLAKGPAAWPFTQYVYAQFRAAPPGEYTYCASRTKLYHFILW